MKPHLTASSQREGASPAPPSKFPLPDLMKTAFIQRRGEPALTSPPFAPSKFSPPSAFPYLQNSFSYAARGTAAMQVLHIQRNCKHISKIQAKEKSLPVPKGKHGQMQPHHSIPLITMPIINHMVMVSHRPPSIYPMISTVYTSQAIQYPQLSTKAETHPQPKVTKKR